MAAGQRPLSPHLQVYRPQLTSVMSITHRFTGMLLTVALLGLVWWLAAAAAGAETYASAMAVLGSWPVRGLAFLATLALFYHMANGVRHLVWDSGRGFELPQVYASGWTAIGVALLLTAATWGLLWSGALR